MKREIFILLLLLCLGINTKAQCTDCTLEITTGGNMLELVPNGVTCITGDATFGDIKWANNATLCVAPGKTLTIQNNQQNNEPSNTVTLEVYGKLVMGNPQIKANLTMNIYPEGGYTSYNSEFQGNNVIINNHGTFKVSGLNLNGNSGKIKILNSKDANFTIEQNLNVGNNINLIYNNEGTLTIGGQFGLSPSSKFSNCGNIKTAGFNLMKGTIYNTGDFHMTDKLDGEGIIYNYATMELQAIQGSSKDIYNYGRIEILSNNIRDMKIYGPTDLPFYGEFRWKGQAGGVNDVTVSGNQIFKNTDGTSSQSAMLQNTSAFKPQANSKITWGDCSDCKVVTSGLGCIDGEDGKLPPDPEIPQNSTFALDDFIETDPNTSISGNVLANDYDLEGNTQAVTFTGTQTTHEGGTLDIKANGDYTYTPPLDFFGIDYYDYTVCDNGTPQACAEARLTIGVGICTVENTGKAFTWSYEKGERKENEVLTELTTQPASDYGYVLDIYKLDNSFNMKINGTDIALHEIEFQTKDTKGKNIRFADGDEYETNNRNIYNLIGDKNNPTLRIIISPSGSISLYGSKKSGGPLFPLVLTSNTEGQNRLNKITWYTNKANEIVVTQTVIGATVMRGYGYGKTKTACTNYWIGGTTDKLNEWKEPKNWTYNIVPAAEKDVIFATEENNPTIANKPKSGPAREDLHLDNLDQNETGGRVIGFLINNSDKDLVVTLGNQLTINGSVIDDNPDAGTIVVKADPTNQTPNGTLLFKDPDANKIVQTTVEFYSKAFDCADCGYYRKSWQYFGIPVKNGAFPVADVDGAETINQWVEPFNGNKWQPAPYTPDATLMAFRGYEMTNDAKTLPKDVYSFVGTLNVGNAAVELTKTATVNYSGVNLIGNSYTAAIPITPDVLTFSQDIADKSVYLFNTGTRDQWRKLNGSTSSGTAAGQYLSVPIKLAGQEELPAMIPSTHAFLVRANSNSNLTISYNMLTKNALTETGMATRAVETTDKVKKLPAILMDVIGQGTADRIWIFSKANTTFGFDSGWDGRKMADEGLSQLYVAATDSSKLQVATVPSFDKVAIGFEPVAEGKYTLEFAPSASLASSKLWLNDKLTGKQVAITAGGNYSFTAKKGETTGRFTLSYTAGSTTFSANESLITVSGANGTITITNGSSNACTAFVANDKGTTLGRREVKAGATETVAVPAAGTYIVRLQNAEVNDMRKVTVE